MPLYYFQLKKYIMNFTLKYSFLCILFTINATASAADCKDHYLNGQSPVLTNKALESKGHTICYTAYSLYTSGLTKTTIWSAEKLEKEPLISASNLKRKDSFHADDNLPREDRAELADYSRSGYDRGHMSPNGDMPDTQSQGESFSLANMIPQSPELNRGLWANIESSVRSLAKDDGVVYVVTGPAFVADTKGQFDALNGRVIIPTHVWKAIYDPKTKEAGAYWVPNSDVKSYESISLKELNNRTGIDVFSSLPEGIKAKVMTLPASGASSHFSNSAHKASMGFHMFNAIKHLAR